MSTGFRAFSVQLFNTRTRAPIDDDSGVCNVLTDGSPVELTIYGDGNGGSTLANPLTFTNGFISFWVADTVTTVDLSILTSTSHGMFVESLNESQHRIDIDPERVNQKLIIPYVLVGASETVVDTGFPQNANMLFTDVEVDVSVLGTGGSLEVGSSTDTDGFVDTLAVSATGFPIQVLEEALVSGSGSLGAYLANTTGSNVRKKHIRENSTSGAKIVYINLTSSSTAGNGYICFSFQRLCTR